MPTAQLASDPTLNTTTGELTDLLVVLRPVVGDNGQTTYGPKNIATADWFSSVFLTALATIWDTLPTTDGTASPFWVDAGALRRTTGGGVLSGTPLSAAAMQQSLRNVYGAASATDPDVAGEVFNPGDGFVHWSNGGGS
ncbi:hypothetical protein MKW11_14650 [Gluconobacter frateurii]|uniref:hypothetical protein n=1 Tax=Gluconobacter frateurii TaxID=38308 RepID=UPI001F06C5C2|nr:hypothetical protein [Gluconobacter frateurii]UMM08405.1 hypothetical protein MKW11_14650 [Gluconobacter frateurii]